MEIFNTKPKVSMEAFCTAYYDKHIFHASLNLQDSSSSIYDYLYNLFIESEPSFSKINRSIFEAEMKAMNLELFSLALFNIVNDFKKSLQHSMFTMNYLKNKTQTEIWEIMSKYNSIIAKTAVIDEHGEPMDSSSATGRMTITRVNQTRMNLFEQLVNTLHSIRENPLELTITEEDEEKDIMKCAARVCNRIEANIYRKNQIGNRQLTALFIQRIDTNKGLAIDYKPSNNFLLLASSNTLSLYESSLNALKAVDLQF